MSATARLAEFVVKTSLEECPPDVVVRVRRAALDTLGVMLAGAARARRRRRAPDVRAEGGIALCTVVGTKLRTGAGLGGPGQRRRRPRARLRRHQLRAAGTSERAAPVDGSWPPARPRRRTGPRAGSRLHHRLRDRRRDRHGAEPGALRRAAGTPPRRSAPSAARPRPRGSWASTSVHAPRRSAIAASLASGLKENFGSMTKPYHAGHAARNGILGGAARARGAHRLRDRARGPSGLRWRPSAARTASTARSTAWGGAGSFSDRGSPSSRIPSCALTHSAIDALIDLRARTG